MTRVLYWNIEKFGINKIGNPKRKRQTGAGLTQAEAALERRALIRENILVFTVGGVPSFPHIIVIVEVTSGFTGRGRLAQLNGGGAKGSLELLQRIRAMTGNLNWRLVPPLQTGPKEAVSIYYDSTNLAFTGPWYWPGGIGPAYAPGAAPTAYNDGEFDTMLPAAVVPPGGRNAGVPQNRLAACTVFTRNAAHATPGAAIDYGTQRAPYWVTFAELGPPPPPPGGPRPVLREISVFGIHSPASAAAAGYLRKLATTAQITDGIGANEVRVIAGDFNVNLLGARPNLLRAGAYTPITAAGYALGIDGPGGAAPYADGYEGYFATHMKGRKKASYWSTNATTQYYPGYGYIGSEIPNQPLAVGWYSIDNIMTRYGVAAGGPMANVTILNSVLGSPFNKMANPAPLPPFGFYRMNSFLANAATTFALPPVIPLAPPPPGVPPYPPPYNEAPAYSIARRGVFRGWNNFARIRSTSDHLAIVADV